MNLPFYQFPMLINRNMRDGSNRNAELVARVPALALPYECAFCCELCEIAGRRRRRGSKSIGNLKRSETACAAIGMKA